MPIYDFQCDCGLRFERATSFDLREEPVKCQSCGAPAPRVMPTSVEGVFHQEAKGIGPQNTGVSSFDSHVDRVIGVSSNDGWKHQAQRAALKEQVLRGNPGVSAADLTELPDGSWEVMDPGSKQYQERGRVINKLAMDSGKYINHDREG